MFSYFLRKEKKSTVAFISEPTVFTAFSACYSFTLHYNKIGWSTRNHSLGQCFLTADATESLYIAVLTEDVGVAGEGVGPHTTSY